MSVRTILVPLDGTDASKSALEMAFTVGRNLAAHVTVLHVRPDPKDAVPLLGEGMSGSMIEEMIQIAETEATNRAAKARALFDAMCASHKVAVVDQPSLQEAVSASWSEEVGREDESTARRGRLADLSVVCRPGPDSDVSSTMTLNAALFETGRPVLVVPPDGPLPVGRKVAVSWNGSAQAARAVASAMPIISGCEELLVLSVEADTTSVDMAPQLATYFAWHGVTAQTKTFAASTRGVGEALLGECAEAGVDLLVMGAYTHSRMRQLILGGVTRHVLEAATLPLFMAH